MGSKSMISLWEVVGFFILFDIKKSIFWSRRWIYSKEVNFYLIKRDQYFRVGRISAALSG
jgi:hypothetical protein